MAQLPPEPRQKAIELLWQEFAARDLFYLSSVRETHGKDWIHHTVKMPLPSGAVIPRGHFTFGMAVRNLLRNHGILDTHSPTGNLDDVYVDVLNAVLDAWKEQTPMESKMPRKVTGHEGSGLNNRLVIESDPRDENGGAHVYSIGLVNDDGSQVLNVNPMQYLSFQNGPLKEAGLNGISDEALLAIVIDRLEGFQTSKFRSRYNALAITNLEQGLMWLQKRTRDRQQRGVEGTHEV